MKILRNLFRLAILIPFLILFFMGGWEAVSEVIVKITVEHPLIIGGYAFLQMIFGD